MIDKVSADRFRLSARWERCVSKLSRERGDGADILSQSSLISDAPWGELGEEDLEGRMDEGRNDRGIWRGMREPTSQGKERRDRFASVI